MANTLVLIDGGAKATIFYLNLHNVQYKQHSSKLSCWFNLDISLVEVKAETDDQEDHPKTLAEKMQSYFSKTISAGKFLVRDHTAFKNLRTV
jgi:hypothetical protein